MSGVVPQIQPTPEQVRAIRTTGVPVLVSAAAGSGKTSVLAQRCVYLVCDAPAPHRCDLDQLLVLTFTEAAAAEMRARIVGLLRSRLEADPDHARLREQCVLADLAHISTVHAFCNDLIRRHFLDAGIDPGATILSEEEADILATAVRDERFETLYRAATDPAHPEHEAGLGFVRLIDDYGLGDDRTAAEFVLRLAAFLDSVPDPPGWIRAARHRLTGGAEIMLAEAAAMLAREARASASAARRVLRRPTIKDNRVLQVRAALQGLAGQLEACADRLAVIAGEDGFREARGASALFEALRAELAAIDPQKPPGARRNKRDPSPEDEALNRALDDFDAVVGRFKKRVQEGVALFTTEELLDGLKRTTPYAKTLLALVESFRNGYAERKRVENVLDFADLERLALRVLVGDGNEGRSGGAETEAAREARRRFRHVLVDEFQDINPVQAAIIAAASREDRASGNLFVVGDVKQSIYRFRLAEPAIFLERAKALGALGDGGCVVPLQHNFRSSSKVIEFVNLVFEVLWRPGGGLIDYDEAACLRHAREERPEWSAPAVEVHLIPRQPVDEGAFEDEPPESPEAGGREDPSQWSAIEREANLIAARILRLTAGGAVRRDGAPLGFADFAVLVRAARVNARLIERMLTRRGIPAYADAGGDFLESREIREVIAALRVLDNPRQDVPLASALRSGMFGPSLSVTELVEVRLASPGVPFHLAAAQYAETGGDRELRDRLREAFETIVYFRRSAREHPLAEVLGELYDRSGHLARAGGAPDGAARRANLLKLHDHAGRFATFHRQGLHRFLRYVELLEDEARRPASASSRGGGADAVRIMTIHASKGLQFPVVFVAGLGAALNRKDLAGAMLFGRARGLGLRVVDRERFLEYPSLAHLLVRDELESHLIEEEMRVLYVAMTRAEDRLILTASPRVMPENDGGEIRVNIDDAAAEVRTADAPINWVLAALRCVGPDRVFWGSGEKDAGAERLPAGAVAGVFAWTSEGVSQGLPEEEARGGRAADLRRAVAGLAPLPEDEPINPGGATREVLTCVDYLYPHLAASSVPAVTAASELKRAFDDAADARETRVVGAAARSLEESGTGAEVARRRGIATHRLLQHLEFPRALREGPEPQIAELIAQRVLSDEDAGLIDVEAVAWFLGTPLASRLASPGVCLHRELAFIELGPAASADGGIADAATEDRVLVRGIVDLALEEDGVIELVDYKTDRLTAEAVAGRATEYAPQVSSYARAMTKVFRKPVAVCHLVFLSARRVIESRGSGRWTLPDEPGSFPARRAERGRK